MSKPLVRYLRRFRRIWTQSATVNRLWYGVGVSHQTAALQYRHSPGVSFIEGDQVRPADEFHLVIGEGNDRTKVESTQESNEDLSLPGFFSIFGRWCLSSPRKSLVLKPSWPRYSYLFDSKVQCFEQQPVSARRGSGFLHGHLYFSVLQSTTLFLFNL